MAATVMQQTHHRNHKLPLPKSIVPNNMNYMSTAIPAARLVEILALYDQKFDPRQKINKDNAAAAKGRFPKANKIARI